MNHRNFATHAAFLCAVLLMVAPDAAGSGSTRETETDPYDRTDVDWDRFNGVLGRKLDGASYKSAHLKALITSAIDAVETQASTEGVGYAPAPMPDELKDNPFAALFGPLMSQDIKVVPHDPDVPATFRAIADALDAAWTETTGRTGREQQNATFRG